MARVKVTPEAAVFMVDGHEVYRGRIDDRYVDFGKRAARADDARFRRGVEAPDWRKAGGEFGYARDWVLHRVGRAESFIASRAEN